jgi:phosphoglucosamine mutase
LAELGADVVQLGVEPDGETINRDCGALHPQGLAAAVVEHNANLGIALDGDGDRVIFADELGQVVDGDEVLAMLAIYLAQQKRLPNTGVVATVMSNIGLDVALQDHGIKLERAPVGDRYVVEQMLAGGYGLGGEQSGHIVFLEHGTTGDGLVTALALLALLVESGQSLSQSRQVMRRFPQMMVNVPVTERRDLDSLSAVQQVIADVSRQLGRRGRVLVRYSGTEALVRVMVEGEERAQVEQFVHQIAKTLRDHLVNQSPK